MSSGILSTLAALMWGAWQRRYLICVPIAIMPFVGLIAGLVTPKKYETTTTILIQEPSKNNPFLQDLTVSTNLKTRMEALKALLHSRHILGDVAMRHGFITEKMSDEDKNARIAILSRSLSATLVGDDLIKIRYQATKPDGMADILSLVSKSFIERVIAPQRSSISRSEDFLEHELESRTADLEKAEKALAEYKSTFASELPDLYAANAARLARISEQLSEKQTALEGAKAAQDSLKRRLAQTNPLVGKIEESIVAAMSELAILRARYTDQHTSVQAAVRRLKSLEEERTKTLQAAPDLSNGDFDRLWNMAAGSATNGETSGQPLLVSQLQKMQEADSRTRGLEEEVASLTREKNKLEEKVSGFGEHERKLAELQRDISVKRKIFADLSERHEKSRVTGALGRAEEGERVKVIDPPVDPTTPANFPLLVYLMGGLVAGVALGAGLGAVFEICDTTVRRREVLQKLLDVPVLSRIPVLPNMGFRTDAPEIDFTLFAPRGGTAP